MSKVIIMQGIPGSGKSTWIKKVYMKSYRKDFYYKLPPPICSVDDYFVGKRRNFYEACDNEVKCAHQECLKKFLYEINQLNDGYPRDVIVDNANCTLWEMAPYVQIGQAYGFQIDVVRMVCDPLVAARRNIYGVSEKSVIEMADKMERPPESCTYREEVTDGSR